MRNIMTFAILMFAALMGLATPGYAAVNEDLFASISGGTTTIDRGGAIHSQARSIYSLGGGMTSFQGKRITLLAADMPGVSAGCSGISWHFGGFAFISVDEIRQMVESIAQASLGVAVDLAMHVLCPQCYAVMSKLRDISNMMRNAAADSCRVANHFARQLPKFMQPEATVNSCSEAKADSGASSSFLGSTFTWCKNVKEAQEEIGRLAKGLDKLLTGGPSEGTSAVTRQILDESGNITYQALTALGYQDGFIKDVLLSYLGMEITLAQATTDCKEAFKEVSGSSKAESAPAAAPGAPAAPADATNPEGTTTGPAAPAVTVTAADAQTRPKFSAVVLQEPSAPPTGSTKAKNTCHAPPVLTGVSELTLKLVCGFEPYRDYATFKVKFPGTLGKSSTLASLCDSDIKETITDASSGKQSTHNPLMYQCDTSTAGCRYPKMQTLNEAVERLKLPTVGKGPATEYTGLAWMVLDALYTGREAVINNKPLSDYPATIGILSHSGYPLYRLINLAAVYPGMADELLQAHGAAIAVHYAMDTMAKLTAPGTNTQISLVPVSPQVGGERISNLRGEIMQMVHDSEGVTNQTLKRLNEKSALVDAILKVNRALQADVISQGLAGNADLVVSIKQQMAPKK